MLKAYTLHTSEIDSAAAAIREIKAQLDGIRLLANSVGIVSCHYDYITGGVAQAVCEALPFPSAGYSTFYQAVPGHGGLFELCVTVLTSDDVQFGVAYVDAPQEQDPQALVAEGYRQICEGRQQAPSVLFGFLSAARPISGDSFLQILDEASGGVPCFGAVAISDNEDGGNTFVFGNGLSTQQGFTMVGLFGKVESRFYYSSFSENMMLSIVATVTKAEGSVVERLNDDDAVTFLQKSGLEMSDESRAGLVTIPFLYRRQGEDVSIARTMVDFTDAGGAVFFGDIPEGSSFRTGYAGPDDILRVTGETAQRAASECGGGGIYFMFSCVGRYITMGLDTEAELRCATEHIPQGTPFLAAYAGGEICPVATNGQLGNRYHNGSFVMCHLR